MFKLKPFLKYKEYRKYIIKKYLKKLGIPTALICTSLVSMMLSIDIIAKDNGIRQLGGSLDNKLINKQIINKTDTNHKVKAVSAALNQETTEAIDIPKKNEEFDYQAVINKLNELQSENEKLKEDNLFLQNSVKIAASKGTRPKNYRLASEITSRSGVLRGKSLGYFSITAYTPTKDECGSDRGITASGQPIIPGVTVAVDTRYWPIGTVFYIKGLGYVVAMDTGGAIKGRNRMDFAVLDREFAKRIGRKKFEVYLISLGDGKVGDIEF